MGYGDFRQEWNHDGWYAALILLLKEASNSVLLREIGIIGDLSSNEERLARIKTYNIGRPSEPPWIRSLRIAYEAALRTYRDAIRAAQTSFRSATLSPMKEARDCLRSLQTDGRFRLYVVSEGKPNVQWMKLKSAGLDAFFDPKRVLTTGDAAEPTVERATMQAENVKLAEQTENVSSDLTAIDQALDNFESSVNAPLKYALNEADIEIKGFDCDRSRRDQCPLEKLPPRATKILASYRELLELRRASLQRIVERNARWQASASLVERILDRMSVKAGTSFYAAAIRAILRDPDAPLDHLKSFASLLTPLRRAPQYRLAMVGDRLDNDINPPLHLLGAGHIVTVHLSSGQYWNQTPSAVTEPSYVADTLAQVKALLLSAHDWDSTAVAFDPPIYQCDVIPGDSGYSERTSQDPGTVGMTVLLQGLDMAPFGYELIPRICAGVLGEFLARSAASLPEWWVQFADPGRGIYSLSERVHRVRAVTNLAGLGFYAADGPLQRPSSVKSCIEADLALLSDAAQPSRELLEELGWTEKERVDAEKLVRQW